MTLTYLVLPPILFLIGAIPSAHLIARRRGVGDLRIIGSQNVGASNIARLAGKKWGALTLVADALKAFVPIALLRGFGVIREIDILWVGILLMLGHNYTPFLGWRGGKGVSVIGGILCYLSVGSVLISLIPAILVYRKLHWVPGLTIALLLAFEACAFIGNLSLTTKLAPLVFGLVSLVATLPNLIRIPGQGVPPALRDDGSTF
ncbi:MAG: glycerol-3-phosphate acyltransferase [Chloroflexota bacterium]|nr:glycerol-3-phosphate acyltransferase [Chloroflexota bacterium]MDQ6906368.1 glycerol-3-phosphate acyltransferase [Chloroflexota bacterium]